MQVLENYWKLFWARVLIFEDIILCIEVAPSSHSEFDFFKIQLNGKYWLHLGLRTPFSWLPYEKNWFLLPYIGHKKHHQAIFRSDQKLFLHFITLPFIPLPTVPLVCIYDQKSFCLHFFQLFSYVRHIKATFSSGVLLWRVLGLFCSLTLSFDILCFWTCKQLTTADRSSENPKDWFLTSQPVPHFDQ